MPDLIKTLKAEHRNIETILRQVHDLGIGTEPGRKAMVSAKIGLLSHLAREDEHLYPPLHEAARDDEIVHDALEFFTADIARVGELAISFFERYEAGNPNGDFSEDFDALLAVLAQRIVKEESVIYRMYDRL